MTKKLHILFLAMFITGISFNTFSQARKYVMIEHFTQASCGPCAQQNPFLEALLTVNRGSIHHIAYHTSWPGVDPMNAYNPSQVADRVTYYGVTGVPDCFMLGNQFHGGPASFSQNMINDAASDPDSIRVLVNETSNGVTRTVHVRVITLNTIPTANYKIRVAVCEQVINYATPPGSNGEKSFPDVFRKMIPSSSGDVYTPAALGDTASFTYTYTLDLTHWDTTRIYSIAFIQNETTKEIINSGSSFDPGWELAPLQNAFVAGLPGDLKTFDFSLINFKKTDDNFRIKVLSDHPTDWSTSFEINGITYMDSIDLPIAAKSSLLMHVNINLGDKAGLGNYTISMKSLSDTSYDPQQLNAYIISQIHELIVNNDGMWGDGLNTYSPSDFQQIYVNALAYAGNTDYQAITRIGPLEKGYANNALTTVWNYYFNISWTFPALTDKSVACFTSELNAGKNLFISGQDVGWDVFTSESSGGHATPNTQSFYNNYMDANWLNDGVSTDNQLIANPADSVFGAVSSSALTTVYGSSYFFPDEIQLKNSSIGDEIFYYNSAHSKVAGVRATNGTWKVVYLAPAPEMIGDTTVSREIIKIAHNWFGSSTVGVKTNTGTPRDYMSINFPNPADNSTTVYLYNIDKDMVLEVVDMTGRVLRESAVGSGSTRIILDLESLSNGLYLYRLVSDGNVLQTRMMQVVH
jgi:thiol-disulfide isomerase/thioredoxin